VYPYDKWESSQQLPRFVVGETFAPKEVQMTDGKTTPPGYLTEPELIALMDANGIGTDATMAEHIATIKNRAYVMTRAKGGGRLANDGAGRSTTASEAARGGRNRGRGSGGRTVAAAGGSGNGGVQEFIPTTLGVALIEGYDNVGFETSLSKPFLRKEVRVALLFLWR
jgi:DNA topoisomerase-3